MTRRAVQGQEREAMKKKPKFKVGARVWYSVWGVFAAKQGKIVKAENGRYRFEDGRTRDEDELSRWQFGEKP